MMLKKILFIAAALMLTACANAQRQAGAINPQNTASQQENMQLTLLINGLKTNKPQATHLSSNAHSSQAYKKLTQIYNQWAGTRYRLGGTGARGIDCSAFMQETFASAFGISLPRSTSEQQAVGKRINKHELKQGDLVFFRSNRHVGVYLGNGKFMHASTSQGVTISSLDENYWIRTYTQSRRVL